MTPSQVYVNFQLQLYACSLDPLNKDGLLKTVGQNRSLNTRTVFLIPLATPEHLDCGLRGLPRGFSLRLNCGLLCWKLNSQIKWPKVSQPGHPLNPGCLATTCDPVMPLSTFMVGERVDYVLNAAQNQSNWSQSHSPIRDERDDEIAL